jgi:hypothetical protein
MPSFREYLESRHSVQSGERNTEMYRLLMQTGSYTEMSLIEEVQALVDRNTDPTMMNEQDLRKFLSFFYVPVRNVVPARGQITVRIDKASSQVTVKPNEYLTARGGLSFRTEGSSGTAGQGETLTLQVAQAISSSFSGVYSNFLSFDAANVDLDSVRVFLAGEEIYRVSSPVNGYMAFYFNGTLYVKIFIGTDIRVIEGQNVSVSYDISDGALGNIGLNSFSSFNYPLSDANGNPVQYTIFNAPLTNGANRPELGELRDILRFWLYTRNTLTKPSDYRLWFLTQPEVGDCLVWGDTENAVMTGIVSITGMIYVCLLDPEGNAVTSDVKASLSSRVYPYKDVGYLNMTNDPTFAYHFYQVKFTGSENDSLFVSDVGNLLSDLYNLKVQRSNNRSLFDSVDVGEILSVLSSSRAKPRGLEVSPMFYLEAAVTTGLSVFTTAALASPANHRRGYTRYEVQTVVEGEVTHTDHLTELMTSANSAAIYDSVGTNRGTHNYQTNTITIQPPTAGSFPDGKIKIFAEVTDRSSMGTGAFSRARRLGGYTVTKIAPAK